MLIKNGSRGDAVKSFQAFLIGKGFLAEGEDDGACGPRSVEGIKQYQESCGLVADGVAGKGTLGKAKEDGWDWSDGPTAAQVAAAEELSLPVEVIQTIEAVESGGKPGATRFEVHVFNRKRPDLKGQLPFTPGPRGYSVTRSETDWDAYQRAYALDPVAATESTSFGLYQVLGGHLIEVYGSPEAGLKAFAEDSTSVSYKLLASWFRDSPRALDAAKDKDWRELARRYNGPGQVDYYESALKREYGRFA